MFNPRESTFCYVSMLSNHTGKKDDPEMVCLTFYFTVNKNGVNVLIINVTMY